MARYRFKHDAHEIEIDLSMDGVTIRHNGTGIDASTIDPDSRVDAGSFVVSEHGRKRRYEWNVTHRVHTISCDGELIFEVDLDDWLDA